MTERNWRCPSILPLSGTPTHATQLPIPSNRFTLLVFLSEAFLWRWIGGGGQTSRGSVKPCVASRRPPLKDLLYFPRIPAAFLCRESLTRCDRVLQLIRGDRLEFSPRSAEHYWTTQNHIAAEKQNVYINYCVCVCVMYLVPHHFLPNRFL